MGDPVEGRVLVDVKPSAEYQVQFLTNVQRLLAEGQFVATYKYALLRALADIAVDRGDDSGDMLPIPTTAIAEKFIGYYWRQANPYIPPSSAGAVLRQNTGRQAEILGHIQRARDAYAHLAAARRDARAWSSLVRKVDAVVRKMPLWKLQTVGGMSLDFLYENRPGAGYIDLRPGVAFCLREFRGLLDELIRGAWVRYVRARNPDVLGTTTDLEEFMFGAERSTLSRAIPVLRNAQDGRCLYCVQPLNTAVHVDHFIPWSRYPVDLGHNFVLAHERCNLEKADHIAAGDHLHAWVERNRHYASAMTAEFNRQDIQHDLPTTVHVANWAYSQMEAAHGLTWLRKRELVPLMGGWQAELKKLAAP